MAWAMVSRWLLAAGFVLAGVWHFVRPEAYLTMMPPYLPAPAVLVAISGLAEIAGGLGILGRTLRVPAGWGLIALLVAVFPANVHVALHGWPGVPLPRWVLWLRLPLQPLLIWAVYRVCVQPPRRSR